MGRAMVSILILCCLSAIISHSNCNADFDVRQHLSTVTRYGVSKNITDNSFEPFKIPDGCTPIHLNLLARHGTRSPTKKRIEELDNLASRLEILVREAEESGPKEVPAWLRGWKSPWKLKDAEELISMGEDELYHLGITIQKSFPHLFDEEYLPNIYPIRATQVPRTSASAVAFGMGLFNGSGTLGQEKHRAFSVSCESRANDTVLRFHDLCQKYKIWKKGQKTDERKNSSLDEIKTALIMRYKLNFTRQDISSLWFLCKQEASLLDITNQACGLFNSSEIALLEWTDDLEMFILKGYGEPLNYQMGVRLLEHVVQSMDQAIKAKENHAPGSYEKANLLFAHAETLIPFSCLLGLFLEVSEFEQIQEGKSLQFAPEPSQNRKWRGSIVSPFAGNNILVLYSCPANSSSHYFVQVLHNEHLIPLPGCGDTDFCPFEDFKDKIVKPHLRHDYNTICNPELEKKSVTDDKDEL